MKMRTVKTLAWKEFHNLLPLLLTLLALESLSLVEYYITQSPDFLSWSEFSIIIGAGVSGIGSIYFLIGVIAGYLMLSSERSQHTLAFLWALPINRYQLYLVKLASTVGVLVLYLIASQLLGWFTQNFGTSSISLTQFSWGLWWLELTLLVGIVSIGIAYGALISNFRVAGILVLLILWGISLFLDNFIPSLNFVSIEALLQPEFFGETVLINSRAWGFHLLLASICCILAGYTWIKHSEPKASGKPINKRQSRLLTVFYYSLGCIFIFGFMISIILPEDLFTEQEAPRGSSLQVLNTEDFLFSYFYVDRLDVQLLAIEAATMAEKVESLLGSNITQQILVDLTDSSEDHLGIAGWRRLRINRTSLVDIQERNHVFTHEMTHVLADQMADRRLSENGSYTRFFNEGLAEWVSYKTLDLDFKHTALRLLAATAWDRLEMDFDDILYWSSFNANFDGNSIYALGLAWIDTLGNLCGDSAPGNILRAMADPDLSQRLQGKVFWQEIMQNAQCDLTAVNNQFILDMERIKSQTEFIPEIVVSKQLTEQNLTFNLRFDETTVTDATASYRVYVKVRDNPDTGPNGIYVRSARLSPNQSVELTLPSSAITGERFQYQVGIEFLEGERPYFNRWIIDG